MSTKNFFAAALVTSSLLGAGLVSAATSVTLNPQATNGLGAAGVLGAAPAFDTTGGTLVLGSAATPANLTINSNVGVSAFTENGRILLTSFTNALNPLGIPGTGLLTQYNVYADFTLTGFGQWGGNVFQASQAGLTFTATLFGDDVGGNAPVALGSLVLTNAATSFAVALTSAPPIPGGSGTANTTFSALLDFTPAAGTTGVGGFFQAPSPFDININLGSVGGNNGNTSYSVSAGGVVTILTPVGGSPSTGNFTFVQAVPEPTALSLVGLALVGAAAATRRKSKKVAAA